MEDHGFEEGERQQLEQWKTTGQAAAWRGHVSTNPILVTCRWTFPYRTGTRLWVPAVSQLQLHWLTRLVLQHVQC